MMDSRVKGQGRKASVRIKALYSRFGMSPCPTPEAIAVDAKRQTLAIGRTRQVLSSDVV